MFLAMIQEDKNPFKTLDFIELMYQKKLLKKNTINILRY